MHVHHNLCGSDHFPRHPNRQHKKILHTPVSSNQEKRQPLRKILNENTTSWTAGFTPLEQIQTWSWFDRWCVFTKQSSVHSTTVPFELASFKKDTTGPETYKQFYLKQVSEYPTFQKIFTDVSKLEDGVAAAAVGRTTRKPTPAALQTTPPYSLQNFLPFF